jgi:hypothetical protein
MEKSRDQIKCVIIFKKLMVCAVWKILASEIKKLNGSEYCRYDCFLMSGYVHVMWKKMHKNDKESFSSLKKH